MLVIGQFVAVIALAILAVWLMAAGLRSRGSGTPLRFALGMLAAISAAALTYYGEPLDILDYPAPPMGE